MSFSFPPSAFTSTCVMPPPPNYGLPAPFYVVKANYGYSLFEGVHNNGHSGPYSWGSTWGHSVSYNVLELTSPWGNLSAIKIDEWSGVSSYFSGPGQFDSYSSNHSKSTLIVHEDTPWIDTDTFIFKNDMSVSEYHQNGDVTWGFGNNIAEKIVIVDQDGPFGVDSFLRSYDSFEFQHQQGPNWSSMHSKSVSYSEWKIDSAGGSPAWVGPSPDVPFLEHLFAQTPIDDGYFLKG